MAVSHNIHVQPFFKHWMEVPCLFQYICFKWLILGKGNQKENSTGREVMFTSLVFSGCYQFYILSVSLITVLPYVCNIWCLVNVFIFSLFLLKSNQQFVCYDKCFTIFINNAEYCERFAKKENITSTPAEDSDEEVSDDDTSDGRSASSEDDVAGHADP